MSLEVEINESSENGVVNNLSKVVVGHQQLTNSEAYYDSPDLDSPRELGRVAPAEFVA